jgi:hypothetical protein
MASCSPTDIRVIADAPRATWVDVQDRNVVTVGHLELCVERRLGTMTRQLAIAASCSSPLVAEPRKHARFSRAERRLPCVFDVLAGSCQLPAELLKRCRRSHGYDTFALGAPRSGGQAKVPDPPLQAVGGCSGGCWCCPRARTKLGGLQQNDEQDDYGNDDGEDGNRSRGHDLPFVLIDGYLRLTALATVA